MEIKIIEIHKNGINANHTVANYYGIDYATKKVIFTDKESINQAKQAAIAAGYEKHQIQWHCNPC